MKHSNFISALLFAGLLLLSGGNALAQGSAADDREALVALYDATGGASWTRNDYWKTAAPIGSWFGVTTGTDGRVLNLWLQSNQLSGPIPAQLGNLTSLTSLFLSYNQLSGSIPTQLGNLTRLQHLNLEGNQLSGPIPTQLGNLSPFTLIELNLSSNQLSGSIPAQLGNLTSLTWLVLSYNQLSGPIPAQLGNLTSLTSLALDTDTGLCLAQDFPLTSPFATLAQALPPSIPVCTATGAPTTISIVGPSTVMEGSAVLFVLTRGGGDQTQALTVNVSVTETGTMLLGTPPMTATFAANAITTMVSIPTDDDTTVEGDSTVTVTLTAATGFPTYTIGSPASATVTVNDDDGEPPGAPGNLAADGGDGQAVLSWDAPSSDGGTTITDYEYRINRSGPWISIGSTDTTHTVTGLVNGTVYVFEVRAVNAAGSGASSNLAEATPMAEEVFTLNFAHFANGDGITSDLVFVNLSTQRSGPALSPFHQAVPPIRPAIYFYDKRGHLITAESVVEVTGDLEIREDGGLSVQTEMEPLGDLTISTHGQGELVSGSVKVVSDGPIGGVLRFDLPDIGVAGVGASAAISDAVFPARRQAGGISTAAALHNLGEAMAVSCQLMSKGVVLEEAEIPLAANGQEARFIEQVFTTTDTSDFVGSVRCTAPREGQFTGIALELDAVNRIFTTLPMVPVQR